MAQPLPALLLVACGGAGETPASDVREPLPMTADHPDLAELSRVLEAHAPELMELEGVAGVAVGLSADGRTPCLKVLVVELTPELEARIPRTLEGQPVELEVSGRLRPLDGR